MLITERPYQIKKVASGTDGVERFANVIGQNEEAFEKRVLFVETVAQEADVNWQKDVVEKLKKLAADDAHCLSVYYGGIPIAYPVEVVEDLKRTWKANADVLLNPKASAQALLNIPLFEGQKDTGFRLTLLKALSTQLTAMKMKHHMNEGQLQTLFYKMVYWFDKDLRSWFGYVENRADYHRSRKAVHLGTPKKHERIYLDLLNQVGVDVWVVEAHPGHELDYEKIQKAIESLQSELPSVPFDQPEQEEVQSLHSEPDDSLKKEEKSYEELAIMGRSVVLIQVYGPGDEVLGRGSGVVIDDHGLIVTNVHVVMKGLKFGIRFENSSDEIFTEHVYFMDVLNDLAFLHVQRPTHPLARVSRDTLKRGQEIVTIGSPLGLMNTISNGIVSGFRTLDGVQFIQITAPISHGSSGGALLNKCGDLVGITTAGFSEGQNLNLAVPVTEVNRILNQNWLSVGTRLQTNLEALHINGIQFIPRLSQDDNKDVVVLLYPQHRSFQMYYQTYINRGAQSFDKGVQACIASVLNEFGIQVFDYYFLPVGQNDE